MRKSRKILLAVLAVMVVGLVAEYTVGGGWTQLMREVKRRRVAQEVNEPWNLPADMGPEDAKLKVLVAVNRGNPCHKDYAEGFERFFGEFRDRVRVIFRDIQADETAKMLEGYPISCEMALLMNGLNTVKVPWRKSPIVLQGPTGGDQISPEEMRRLVEWALGEEGQRSLKKQRHAFEEERKKRAAKDKALKEKAAKEKSTTPSHQRAPGPEKTGSAR
jgi:hypothetical protein